MSPNQAPSIRVLSESKGACSACGRTKGLGPPVIEAVEQRRVNWPSKNSAEKRCVQTFGRREAPLHFGHGDFVLGGGTEQRQSAGNRTEQVTRSQAASQCDRLCARFRWRPAATCFTGN